MYSTLQIIDDHLQGTDGIPEDENCDGMHIKVQTVQREMVLCADLALHQDVA